MTSKLMVFSAILVLTLLVLAGGVLLAAQESRPYGESHAGREARQPKGAKLGEYVSFPEAGVKVRQPDGFALEDSFEGFGRPETQSSVMALSLPGPFSEISAGFNKEHLAVRGWKLLDRQEMKVGDLPAVLVHLEQPAGGKVFEKWSLTFGNETRTMMVTAAFPKDVRGQHSEHLKAAVLSTQLASEQESKDDALTIAPSKKLLRAAQAAGSILYTATGKIPTDSPKDPLFIVGQSFGETGAANKRQFAERRLRSYAHTTGVSEVTTEPFKVDGLDGFESTATAVDKESGTPLTLYQAIVFDNRTYYLLTGLVGTEKQREYLPEFKRLARSFKRASEMPPGESADDESLIE